MKTEKRIKNELAISIAWWNSRDVQSRETMLRSIKPIENATAAIAWEKFGTGSYRRGWRPTESELQEAYEIIKNSTCMACDEGATDVDGLCESCRESAGYYVS